MEGKDLPLQDPALQSVNSFEYFKKGYKTHPAAMLEMGISLLWHVDDALILTTS